MSGESITEQSTEMWERRRRNIRHYMAQVGDGLPLTSHALSKKAGIPVNTVSKFLKGTQATLTYPTLEKIAFALELPSAAYLDVAEPWSTARADLGRLIADLPLEQVESLRRELFVRFPDYERPERP